MFFTREDILKIQQALLKLGVKDSELPSAEPVTYNDTLSIVQEGKNKQIGVKDFCNQISLWKREDFINITDKYDEHYISLTKAINLVPVLQRKDGLVITFQDTNGDWRIYQFRGNITEFFNEEKWFDLYDYRNYIINSIVPDEEDLTASTPNENGTSIISLKDRPYNTANFISKGYKILRKNIQTINGSIKNILTQDMISKSDTIYEIRYDFDLNGETIRFPNNITLKFNGGCLFNGKIRGNTLTQNDLTIDNFKNPKSNDDTEALQLFIDACYNVNISRTIHINKTIYLRASTNLIGTSRRIAYIVFDTKIDDFVIKVSTNDSPYKIENLDDGYWSSCYIKHLRIAYKDPLNEISNDFNDYAPKCLLFNNNGVIEDVNFSNFKIDFQRDRYMDQLTLKDILFGIHNVRKLNYDPKKDFNVILNGPCGDNIILENISYANIYVSNVHNLSIINGIQLGLKTNNADIKIKNLHNENTDLFPININLGRFIIENSFFMLKENDYINVSFANGKIINCIFNVHLYIKKYLYNSPNCIKTIKSKIELKDNYLGFGSPIKVNNQYIDNCTIYDENKIIYNNFYLNGTPIDIIIKSVPISKYFDNSKLDEPIIGNFNNSDVTYDVYVYLNYERKLLVKEFHTTIKPTINELSEIKVYSYDNAIYDIVLIRTFNTKKQYYFLQKCYIVNTYIDNNYIFFANNNNAAIDINNNIIITNNKSVYNSYNNGLFTVYVDKLKNALDLSFANLKPLDSIILTNGTTYIGKLTKSSYVNNNNFPITNTLDIKQDNNTQLSFLANIDDNSLNKYECIIYSRGKFKDVNGIDITKRYGDINNLPLNVRKGQIYYLNDSKPIFYNGTTWLDSNGNPANVQTQGPTNDRPSNVKLGFIYKDTTLDKLIIWDGTKWINLDGTELS